MTNLNIVPFDFEGNAVRVATTSGDPRFVLADICRVLEIGNAADAARRLDDDEKGVDSIDTLGGTQQATVINESGLYSLILTSRKRTAKRFKKWVTAEVLPAIRKTGGYMMATSGETTEELALRALTVLQATVDRQKAQLAEATPKADALDRIATAGGSLCLTEAAKALQVRPKDLLARLRAEGWIYKRPGSATWLGYSEKANSGLLEHKVTTITREDGTEKIAEQVRVTPKGLAKLAQELAQPQVQVSGGASDAQH